MTPKVFGKKRAIGVFHVSRKAFSKEYYHYIPSTKDSVVDGIENYILSKIPPNMFKEYKKGTKIKQKSYDQYFLADAIYEVSSCLKIDPIILTSKLNTENSFRHYNDSKTKAKGISQLTTDAIREVEIYLGELDYVEENFDIEISNKEFIRPPNGVLTDLRNLLNDCDFLRVHDIRPIFEEIYWYKDDLKLGNGSYYQKLKRSAKLKKKFLQNSTIHTLLYGAIYLKIRLAYSHLIRVREKKRKGKRRFKIVGTRTIKNTYLRALKGYGSKDDTTYNIRIMKEAKNIKKFINQTKKGKYFEVPRPNSQCLEEEQENTSYNIRYECYEQTSLADILIQNNCFYKVKRNEFAGVIAKKKKISLKKLKKLNHKVNMNKIRTNQILRVCE